MWLGVFVYLLLLKTAAADSRPSIGARRERAFHGQGQAFCAVRRIGVRRGRRTAHRGSAAPPPAHYLMPTCSNRSNADSCSTPTRSTSARTISTTSRPACRPTSSARTALLPKLTQNIPLIGNRLKDGINFLDDIRNTLTGLAALPADADAQDLIDQLTPAFASWNDGAVTITATTNYSGSGSATKVDFEFQLAKDLGVRAAEGGPVDFNLGLPNLKLDVETNLDLHVEFLLKFKITIDKNDAAGPYIDTTPTIGAGQTPEMSFDVTATMPGTEIAAKLGILNIKLQDGGSALNFGFQADITDPDNKLHVGTTPETPGVTAKMKDDARAHLDVDAQLRLQRGRRLPRADLGRRRQLVPRRCNAQQLGARQHLRLNPDRRVQAGAAGPGQLHHELRPADLRQDRGRPRPGARHHQADGDARPGLLRHRPARQHLRRRRQRRRRRRRRAVRRDHPESHRRRPGPRSRGGGVLRHPGPDPGRHRRQHDDRPRRVQSRRQCRHHGPAQTCRRWRRST